VLAKDETQSSAPRAELAPQLGCNPGEAGPAGPEGKEGKAGPAGSEGKEGKEGKVSTKGVKSACLKKQASQ
jgi:hypothetical protein